MVRSVTAMLALVSTAALQPTHGPRDPRGAIVAAAGAAKWCGKAAATCGLAAALLCGDVAHADKRQIGAIEGSGLFFKDTLVIDAFRDPKIEGVTIYISDFERPLAERLSKDFFSDPSQAGLSCARRAQPLVIAANVDRTPNGEDVVAESKSLLFKTLRVKRVIDPEQNAAIYVAFSTRVNKDDDSNKSRFSSSLCTVPLDDLVPNSLAPATATAPAR